MMKLTKVVDYGTHSQPHSSDSSYCNLAIAGAQSLGTDNCWWRAGLHPTRAYQHEGC